ncbi:metacaspase-1-like protein, partial [Trifolium pratense]
ALSKITSTGAMTFCFIQAVERCAPGAAYGTILTSMRSAIKNAGSGGSGGGDVVTSLISMLLTGGSLSAGGLRQEPQLTAGEAFDVYRKPFSL